MVSHSVVEKASNIMATPEQYEVGGVRLEQPFKVRRLGHVGLGFENLQASYDFYHDLLGFRISDTIDLSARADLTGLGDSRMYFTRCGSDHHTLVFLGRAVRGAVFPVDDPMMDIQQISWQVDSLSEIKAANHWLSQNRQHVTRVGRDMPGSNWHVYFKDADGHQNELFYGMEQVGWDGTPKPVAMYRDRVSVEFPIPQRSETQEVEDSIRDGIDVFAGRRDPDIGSVTYDVGGVLLQRPFRVTRIGSIGLFVRDVSRAVAFYTRIMGFTVTEQVPVSGFESVFLRANDEHHSLGLYPFELRNALGIQARSTCAVLGFQVANYSQLRNAVTFLKQRNVPVFDAPLAFNTGIDYAAHFLDPDGHLVRLYHAMERVNWVGQPKPVHLRQSALPANWPEVLPNADGGYAHEVFQGPVG
jgi:catechol 2,3-dioxygenase-like lactoylglutathione lyase family enzyme